MADVEENENPGPETNTEVADENQQLETGQESTENGSTVTVIIVIMQKTRIRILLSRTQSLTIILRRGETRRLTRFNKNIELPKVNATTKKFCAIAKQKRSAGLCVWLE